MNTFVIYSKQLMQSFWLKSTHELLHRHICMWCIEALHTFWVVPVPSYLCRKLPLLSWQFDNKILFDVGLRFNDEKLIHDARLKKLWLISCIVFYALWQKNDIVVRSLSPICFFFRFSLLLSFFFGFRYFWFFSGRGQNWLCSVILWNWCTYRKHLQ